MQKEKISIFNFLLIIFLLIFTSVVFAASKEIRDNIVEIAQQQIGKEYVWATEGPNTFDCSGLVYYVYLQSGININRQSAAGLYNISASVDPSDALPGDLVFLQNTGGRTGITHVGIYKGNDIIIHAGDESVGVTTDKLSNWENLKDFAGVRRIDASYWPNNDNNYVSEEEKPSPSQSSSSPSQSQGPSFSPSPPGLAGGSDTLSFWDKVAFYWNGFVANLKQLFGGTTGEVQVAQPLTNTEIQQQVNQNNNPSPVPSNQEATTNNPQQSTENSSPSAQSEVWNQRFISYELTEKDKEQGIYQLVLKFQNTGNTTWTPNNVSLNIVGGYQSTAAKFYHPSWTTKLRPTKLITTIEPGGNAFFTFLLQFPKDPGTYYPQFQPVYYDGTNFHWIGSDKAIFLAEIKQSSQDTFAFAGASLEEIINSNQETQNPETTVPPISYYYPPQENNSTSPSSPTGEEESSQPPQEETESPQQTSSFTYSPQRRYEDTNGQKINFVVMGENITFDASTISTIDLSSFDQSSISYEWDFGDGTQGLGEKVNHIYTIPDTYKVTLTINDNKNNTQTFTQEIIVKQLITPLQWQKTFEGIGSDYGYDIEETEDGYIIAGYTYSNGIYSIYLIKTNKEGEEQWRSDSFQINSFSLHNSLRSSLFVADDHYILAGGNKLIKIDNNGTKKWEKELGIEIYDVVGTEDGYICVGDKFLSGNFYGEIIKTNLDGDEFEDGKRWTIEMGKDYFPYSIKPTSDGYIIGGVRSVCRGCGVGGSYDSFWLEEIDKSGTIKWQKEYRGEKSTSDVAYSAQQTVEGGYVVVGTTAFHSGLDQPGPSNNNILLIKTLNDGTERWKKSFDLGKDEGYDVIQTTDSGYMIIGNTADNEDSDIWLIKTDSEGNKTWDLIFSGENDYPALGYSVKQTSDEGYIIVGSQYIKDNSYDIWLIKLGPEVPIPE